MACTAVRTGRVCGRTGCGWRRRILLAPHRSQAEQPHPSVRESCSVRDGRRDRQHALRGAALRAARSGQARPLRFPVIAIRDHGAGLRDDDVTVLTCWDADRLDLGRVGIRPRAKELCTAVARNPQLMAWAYERSLADRW